MVRGSIASGRMQAQVLRSETCKGAAQVGKVEDGGGVES